MYRKVLSLLSFILFVNLSLAPNLWAVEWKMPIAGAIEDLHGQLAADFAKKVDRITDGRLKITVYPSATLYQNDQIFGAVKNNLAPLGSRLISALNHENRLFQLDSLPLLARNYTQAFKLYKASKQELEKVLRVKGVKLLYAVPWPAQGMYSRVKVQSLEEFKGLTFRPYSKLTAEFGTGLGMESVVFPLADLNDQLKSERLDIVFGSALAAKRFNLSEFLPYWYDLRAWLPKEMVVVNLKAWQLLSSKDRQNIMNVAMTTESNGWLKSKEVDEEARSYLVESGVSIELASAQLNVAIEDLATSIIRRWLSSVGDKGRYIWERYMKL